MSPVRPPDVSGWPALLRNMRGGKEQQNAARADCSKMPAAWFAQALQKKPGTPSRVQQAATASHSSMWYLGHASRLTDESATLIHHHFD